jgi:transposase-like protein
MVAEIRPNYPTEWAAMKAVAARLGIGTAETVRTWVRKAEVDGGHRPGVTSEGAVDVFSRAIVGWSAATSKRAKPSRPCAGTTPASPSSSSDRRRRQDARRPGPSATRPSARAPTSASPRPAGSWPSSPRPPPDRTWDKRMLELLRPDLLILDDFAMRQLSSSQADDL